MEFIGMRCTSCGAELQVDPERKQVFCSYCGTKLMLDDDSVEVTNRIIDEARIKEAEVRLKELEYAHERELRKEILEQEQKKAFRISLIVFACVLVAAYSIAPLRPLFAVILLCGLIAVISEKKGDQNSIQRTTSYTCSPKSRLAALVICFFFGVFGGHYYYVGKIGTGILYLFTFGLFGIGWLIDMIRIACGTFRDKDGLYLKAI